MNRGPRVLALVGILVLAVVLESIWARYLAVDGVVPDLVLLVVVAVGIVRGAEQAAITGFAAGLLLDLAPPADHAAGRWALALLIAGYLAGRVRREAAASPLAALAVVAATSFVATSIFALSGRILGEGSLGVGATLQVIVIALLWDLMLAPWLLPPLLRTVGWAVPDRLGEPLRRLRAGETGAPEPIRLTGAVPAARGSER